MKDFILHAILAALPGVDLGMFAGLRVLLVQTVGASLLGVIWALAARRLNHARRTKLISFLVLQLLLIVSCDFAGPWGILAMVGLLGAFAGFSRLGIARGAAIVFTVFLLFWLVEKYLLPFSVYFPPPAYGTWMFGTLSVSRATLIVGISYIGFKLIHFVVDRRSGDIQTIEPLEFLGWMLFFPSIVAGPMQRYQDWIEQRNGPGLTAASAALGLRRLVSGLVLKFVLANTIYGISIANMSTGALQILPGWQVALGAVCYSLYLYWDFSGYTHMAIGVAHFWGIKLPENFIWPFAARNLAEFWNRWHITLSQILRDYLYYPLSLALKRLPLGKRHPNFAAAIPPFVTFLLAGLWHGPFLGFILYGALQGAGLGYLAVRARYRSKSALAQWWRTSTLGHILAAGVNFTYVSFSLMFFCLPYDSLAVLWHRIV